MTKATSINCLFVDVGGVLLSNGWDESARRRAAKHFRHPFAEVEERHRLAFDAYEEGRLTLQDYLSLVVYPEKRPFTRAAYVRFMMAQSRPFPDMLALVHRLKLRHGLKVVVVSNEGRELNDHRIRKFRLERFVDTFVSSCFVHLRKPDPRIFALALDVARVEPRNVVYIENTPMFVQVAEGDGIRSILHRDFRTTRDALAALGLPDDESVGHDAR